MIIEDGIVKLKSIGDGSRLKHIKLGWKLTKLFSEGNMSKVSNDNGDSVWLSSESEVLPIVTERALICE